MFVLGLGVSIPCGILLYLVAPHLRNQIQISPILELTLATAIGGCLLFWIAYGKLAEDPGNYKYLPGWAGFFLVMTIACGAIAERKEKQRNAKTEKPYSFSMSLYLGNKG